jgi:hypothetical protein
MNRKKAPKKQPEDYRRLTEKVRETAQTVSTERDRAELLAMAKIWDFLADHYRIVRHRMSRLAH